MKDRSDCLEDVQIFCWEKGFEKELYDEWYFAFGMRTYNYGTTERTSFADVKEFGGKWIFFCFVFLNRSGVAVGCLRSTA